MNTFPEFMKNPVNRVPSDQQNTEDIEGYYFEGVDGSQVAFWECHADKTSKPHMHGFDEYMICISGEYTAFLDGEKIVLAPGDELFIPKGTEQRGECKKGTRTIHVFGGKRIYQ